MRIRLGLILILPVAIFVFQLFGQTGNSEKDLNDELAIILENCAEYCQRLENIALYYVCEEKITEFIFSDLLMRNLQPGTDKAPDDLRKAEAISTSNEKNSYVYDYQLKREGLIIDERRILLKENGRKKNLDNAQLQTKRFRHKTVVYGPIGLLGRRQQEKFTYVMIGEARYKGTRAVIIEAKPNFPAEFDALYGKIWIGKKDSSILKIEWQPESMKNFEKIERIAEQIHAKPKIQFVSEYGFEKNRIRFPNRYSVEEIYVFASGYRFQRSETTVLYDNYKFFIVETAVKY